MHQKENRLVFLMCCQRGLCEHKKNKSDELIRAIEEKGGFVGLSQFGPHMKRGMRVRLIILRRWIMLLVKLVRFGGCRIG
jgi:microsomal dipeptidase-like Zn-dependent dipeptidase